MDIQAICHACILARDENTTVLIDPWITGLVFLGGWALEPPPIPEVVDALPPIQHIYLTHEHPDHSHMASLKLLFAKCAKDATVHIPRFMTERFIRHLKDVFPDRKIEEMKHGREYRLGTFRAWSYQYRNDDSALVLEDPRGDCLANLNDTFVKGLPLAEIHRRHPRIKTVMSQFSVSNAYPYGYADYERSPESFPWSAEDLKSYCVSMLAVLKPERWIPYHSFVAFCREENEYLNRYRISLDEISDDVASHGFNVVKLYPGDLLSQARAPYPGGEDHFRAKRTARIQTPLGDSSGLNEAAMTFEKSFRKTVFVLIRRALRPQGFVVAEDGLRLLFDPSTSRFQFGDKKLQEQYPHCSWTTTNRQTLTQALKLPWGMGDLLISGRMRTETPEQFRAVDFRFWAVSLIRHTGYFNLSSLWFLRPRAIDTAFRRRIEAADILQRSFSAGGFLAGNIEPRRQSE